MHVAFQLAPEGLQLGLVGGLHRRQVVVPLDARGPQVGQRRPVGPLDGGVAAGQRHVAEVGHPGEAVVAGQQHLAAPDGPVGAVAGAVEGEAQDLFGRRHAVFGHDRRHMGVVVLDQRQAAGRGGWVASVGAVALCPRPSCGCGSRGARRRPVVRARPGRCRGTDRRALEGGQGLGAAHVADVLAHPGVGARRPGRRCS